MRAIYSYGVAAVIVVAGALWLGSGVLVSGGKGPGKGETPMVEAVSRDKAPLTPEQQQLVDEADAKTKAAADAKKAADDAAAEAAKAKTAADESTNGDLQKELTAKADEARKKAGEAKAAADAATKAAQAAEDELNKAHEELNATKSISERLASTTEDDQPVQSVRTQTFAVQAFPIEVPLRGRTKAKSLAMITPETSGVVTAVNVAKGQAVQPGEILCTLEEGPRAAAVAQAEAAVAQAQTASDSNKALREKGLAASNTGIVVEAALRQAQTALIQARTEFERANVRTKVAGVVQDPVATVGTMLSPGQPCATVVELDPMLFIGTVPEARINQAKLGLPAKIETVTGQTIEGKVSYIASLADEATRSFPVEIEIANTGGKVLSGVTATATVNVGTMPAHLLPQSVLTLDDEGTLGVRAVKDGSVLFYPVTIVSDSRQGVWVTGLPPKVDVITVGQEFVTAGQKVNATNVAPEAQASGAATTAEGAQS